LKIRQGAIVDFVVTYVYAKFGDDLLLNEKALADRKSDDKNTKNNTLTLTLSTSWMHAHLESIL